MGRQGAEVAEAAVGYAAEAGLADDAGAAAGWLAELAGWTVEEAAKRLARLEGVALLAHPDGPAVREAMGPRVQRRIEAAKRLLEHALARNADRLGRAVVRPDIAAAHVVPRLRGEAVEVLGMLGLDQRHRPIGWRRLHRGGLSGTECRPGAVARAALGMGALTVVLAHNHPSGEVEPSAQDRAVTEKVKQALELVDVVLLDHIVVGPQGQWQSVESPACRGTWG